MLHLDLCYHTVLHPMQQKLEENNFSGSTLKHGIMLTAFHEVIFTSRSPSLVREIDGIFVSTKYFQLIKHILYIFYVIDHVCMCVHVFVQVQKDNWIYVLFPIRKEKIIFLLESKVLKC